MARPRSDIRPRIITSAREAFLRDGVDGASLRKIAQEAGTSIGMVYYYFPTKDDLFLGVVEDVYGALLDDIAVALADDGGVEARIERLFQRLGRTSDVEFDVIRIIIREALVSSSRLAKLIERVRRGHVPLVFRTMQEGVADGTVTNEHPLPVIMAATASVGAIPQLVRRLVLESAPHLAPLFPASDVLAHALVDILMHGIRARSRDEKG
jgi:AcrR family transcriptional regulator